MSPSKNTMERLLEEVAERDEWPKDFLTPLPLRPKSKGRPPSSLPPPHVKSGSGLPWRLLKNFVCPKSEGKKDEQTLRNDRDAILDRVELVESPCTTVSDLVAGSEDSGNHSVQVANGTDLPMQRMDSSAARNSFVLDVICEELDTTTVQETSSAVVQSPDTKMKPNGFGNLQKLKAYKMRLRDTKTKLLTLVNSGKKTYKKCWCTCSSNNENEKI
ncbi:myosin-2 [Canna indica]|uniref:Myosin-2 n=1 Tax=Canna indica TaxID=4628 RepID=A0AAQ3KGT4_9LILI|nr:myosin-2 [Canna indica]